MFRGTTWDERYKSGPDALPWDDGIPSPELVECFSGLPEAPESVLEIGCGTGTNAIWLAQKGAAVVATDISPTAIDAAKKKCAAAGVKVDLKVSDIVEAAPVPPGSVDFVFDRGVFHVMEPQNREVFIDRVAASLTEGGYWLCLAGSCDEIRGPEEMGPPQLKASELIEPVEGKFEVHRLGRSAFVLPGGKPHLAWTALFKKRPL